MAQWGATLLSSVMTRLVASESQGRSRIRTASSLVVRAPLKALAVFFTAPFLAYRVARFAKSRTRRIIARVGLVLSVIVAWFAGTSVGIGITALLLMAHVGFLYGLAFWVGATFSFLFSVVFSLLALNATATLFLGLSSEEVLEHLNSLSS
jgi:hypothetical protein